MIRFLKDYSVGQPPETFSAGQEVDGRGPESEAHFVRRGVAAYLAKDGTLTDFDGNVVTVDGGGHATTAAPKAPKAPKAPAEPEPKPLGDGKPPADAVLSGTDLKKADPA
jgi:hypothetical protein